jgi:hypothetical protein
MVETLHGSEANRAIFGVSDIDEFNLGKQIPIETIAAQHGMTSEQKAKFEELVLREKDELIAPQIVGDTLHIRSTIYNTARTRAIDIRFIGGLKEQSVKPLLLWLPPWGVPNWTGTTQMLDEALQTHYRVAHLSYSQNEEEYTFTGSGLDMRTAIEQLLQLHERLNILPNNIVLIGVSVSAFMAAELANIKFKSISALCLMMPAVDLFGALDTFRQTSGKELFTRKVYLAKDGFRCNQLGSSLRYFQGHMEFYHLFDLSYRGATKCNMEYFVQNIKGFIKSGGRVCIAGSKQDTMTKGDVMKYLESMLIEKDCVFNDVEWFHDVKRGMRYYSTVNPNRGGDIPKKLKGVVRWLKQQSACK